MHCWANTTQGWHAATMSNMRAYLCVHGVSQPCYHVQHACLSLFACNFKAVPDSEAATSLYAPLHSSHQLHTLYLNP